MDRGGHRDKVASGVGNEFLGGGLLIGEDVYPLTVGKAVSGKGKANLLPLLQHSEKHFPFRRTEKTKAINEHRSLLKVPVFSRQLSRPGDVVQRVTVAPVNHGLIGPIDAGNILQLGGKLGVLPALGLGDGGQCLGVCAALLQFLHGLEHGIQKRGPSPLALVNGKGVLHFGHRQLHQHQPGSVGKALSGKPAPGSEDVLRKAGKAQHRN